MAVVSLLGRQLTRWERTASVYLLLHLNIELIPGHQLQDVFKGQSQELLGHGDLHEVLVNEAVGVVVENGTHHGFGKLAHPQAVLWVEPLRTMPPKQTRNSTGIERLQLSRRTSALCEDGPWFKPRFVST